MVSRILGIPEITLRVWKASVWWKEVVDDLKMQEKIELSNRMKKLVEASQLLVAQRLEHGDPVMNQKTGEIIMKPVSMKDAHKVAVDLIDRRTTLEKMTEDNGPSEERNDDKLAKLAEKFAEIATKSIEKKINKQRTVDAEDVTDALYEERPQNGEVSSRLQTGSSLVYEQAGSEEEAFGTDDGSSGIDEGRSGS
jgi:hypothetical protein